MNIYKFYLNNSSAANNIIKVLVALLLIFLTFTYMFPKDYVSSSRLSSDGYEGLLPIVSGTSETNYDVSTISQIRLSFFEKYHSILSAKYQVGKNLFYETDPHAPWFSAVDEYFYPVLESSFHPEIPDEELGLLNPAILVYPKFNSWTGKLKRAWNNEKIASHGLTPSKIELFPKPINIEWSSSRRSSKLTYELSAYKQQTDPLLDQPINYSKFRFCSVDFNAVDLGLDYISTSNNSVNITALQENRPSKIFPVQFAHLPAEMCNLQANGCNRRLNMSDSDRCFSIEALPAFVEFLLWDNAPRSQEDPADFSVQIQFN